MTLKSVSAAVTAVGIIQNGEFCSLLPRPSVLLALCSHISKHCVVAIRITGLYGLIFRKTLPLAVHSMLGKKSKGKDFYFPFRLHVPTITPCYLMVKLIYNIYRRFTQCCVPWGNIILRNAIYLQVQNYQII